MIATLKRWFGINRYPLDGYSHDDWPQPHFDNSERFMLAKTAGWPGGFWVDDMTHPFSGQSLGEGVISTHPPEKCMGRYCCIHAPSINHTNKWPMAWRADTRVMERTCPHGVGHPDPDDVAFHIENREPWKAEHGCDGCC